MVISSSYELHPEACAYLENLRGPGSSVNTEKSYAGRVALFLSYCAERGIDWTCPTLGQFSAFLHWLVEEPLPPRGRVVPAEPRYREEKTANTILSTTSRFLEFCSSRGWVSREVVDLLWEPKFLRHAPPGYDVGEEGQFREIRGRTVKFKVAVEGYEWLSSEQIETLIGLTRNARDRFLVMLLAATGARIGEVLGLRREDMHFLSDSRVLGCPERGPHVHVRRRANNANGALAKSRKPRSVPVENDVVSLYSEYQYARDAVAEATESDMVFVNLFRQPLGEPMKYHGAKDLFDRLAKKAGFAARPHMLRHSAATRWIRGGTDRDVVQDLLGHVSSQSMEPYIHSTDKERREAVERGAAHRKASS
ncbi:tyrosine-type recombinase/integrase [Streptomyces sp. NPDC058861]|uniref:tyrosine-type recombinase/integrase n=1 Tax=Streptomyces sp. NPDC058861 TaxID=3346653 RepID=UPI0036C6FC2F